MQDSIIKGTGNSRYLKGAGWPATYEEFKSMAEAGTLPIDLAGINADGWQQIGMAFAKANLLSDATAAKYFVSVVGTETVDQVLSLLGRFQRGIGNEYVWKKDRVENVVSIGALSSRELYDQSLSYTYGKSASVSGASVVIGDVFVPEQTAKTDSISYYNTLVPFYYSDGANVYYAASTISGTNASIYFNTGLCAIGQASISYGYVNSPNSDAYPPAESDGYTYTAIGQIGSKVQIATGSYTGTGTYGSGSPNILAFEAVPRLVIISYRGLGSIAIINPYFTTYTATGVRIASSTAVTLYCKADQTSVDWYNTANADNQMNSTGSTYDYWALLGG